MLSETILGRMNQLPTPFYIYDLNNIKSQINHIKNSFTSDTNIYYSMKANPNISLIKQILLHIKGLEIASHGELAAIINSGIETKNLILVGPAKDNQLLHDAIKNQIQGIVVESIDEIKRIANVCGALDMNCKILIRINPFFTAKGYALEISGGKQSKFGIDEGEIADAIRLIKNYKQLQLIGFHCYLGSRILDVDHYKSNLKQVINIFDQYLNLIDQEEVTLAFGGGIGVPYFSGEESFNLIALRDFMQDEISQLKANHRKKIHHILELGSFLVAESGHYVVKIMEIKKSKGKVTLIVDGGINHNLGAASRSAWEHKPSREYYPMHVFLDKCKTYHNEGYSICDVVGPICTGADVLARGVYLPQRNVGDYIVIRKSGAYGLTDSLALFLSHGIPAEFMIDGDNIYQIKPPQHGSEYLKSTFNSIRLAI